MYCNDQVKMAGFAQHIFEYMATRLISKYFWLTESSLALNISSENV